MIVELICKERNMKKLLIFSVFLFALLSCKQINNVPEITITVKVDGGINLKDEKSIKAKKGVLWKELKTIAASKIETKEEYAFLDWKLNDQNGKTLSDDDAFNKDEVVYAVSKRVKKNAHIKIRGDERLSITGDDFINIDIFVPKTFKDVEAEIKAKLSLKPEWNNGDYDIFDWKLNDENGELILESTPITEAMTVFARTNYTKFKIEETTIKGYTGEKPRGRIIIPKEITKVGNDDVRPFCACRELLSIDLSLCTKLTYLNLSYTEITSIDVSKNTELTYLRLDGTGITSIDVSNNIELTQLDLGEARAGITSLDVSNNTKLTYLDLYNTGITSIDVSNNIELTELSLSETGITSIDVSKNTELTKLYLSYTGITSIDVSKNTELTHLHLYDTGIKSIDVSKNTKLIDVLFKNCSALTAVDLSTCTKLDELYSYFFSGAVNAVVTLPSSIKKIGKKSFGDKDDNYCKKVIVPNNEIKKLVLGSGYPEARIEVKP